MLSMSKAFQDHLGSKSQCFKLILFLCRFLATVWSKKVAKYQMSVAKRKTIKLEKKIEISFFPW